MNNKHNEKELPKRVTLCTMKEFEQEFWYLKKQPNQSFYVWNLIRQDLKKQIEDKEILEIVRQAMQTVSSEVNVNNNSKQKENVNNLEQDKLKKGAMSILGQ